MQQQVSVWDYLKHQLQVLKLEIADETAQQVPFDFWGGYVGYLGYELKAECGGEHAHQAPTPDAAMFLADRCFTALHLHLYGLTHRFMHEHVHSRCLTLAACPVFSTSTSSCCYQHCIACHFITAP